MQVDSIVINTDLLIIVQELRTQLALQGINRFAKMIDSGDDLMVCCPYHKDGQERRPSAGIRKSDGLLHCFACGETHSLAEVISNCFGYNDKGRFGLKWLAHNFASAEIEEREDIDLDCGRNTTDTRNALIRNNIISDTNSEWGDRTDNVYVTEEELDKYRYTHKYMYERGLTDKIIELFDIGYDKVTNSITFPVKDYVNNCLFIARRNIGFKSFNIPKDIDKPLYGANEIWHYYYSAENELDVDGDEEGQTVTIHERIPEVYVCEGLFDCLRLWCNGKFAVAGFGCLYNDGQIKELRGLPTRNLILAFDNDEPGRDGAERIRQAVTNKIIDTVILPKDRHDIGECTDEEIQNLEIEL